MTDLISYENQSKLTDCRKEGNYRRFELTAVNYNRITITFGTEKSQS